MMVFSEQKVTFRSRKPHPDSKRWAFIGLFIVVLAISLWFIQPKHKSGGQQSGSFTSEGSGNTIGTLKATDGQIITNAEIKIADEKGNPIQLLRVNQNGQFQFSLSKGTYLFTINVAGQQLTKQIKIENDSVKKIEIEINITSEY